MTNPIKFSAKGSNANAMNYYESGEGYPFVSVVPFSDFNITIKSDVENNENTLDNQSINSNSNEETEPIPTETNPISSKIKDFTENGEEIEAQSLGFKPNLSEYRNDEVAEKNLIQLSETVKLFFLENPNNKVYIVGSEATGSYGVENSGTLSLKRAEKVSETIKSLIKDTPNIDENLVVIGAGTKLPWRAEPEFNEELQRNEENSQSNRAVWIIPITAEEKVTQLRNAGFVN